MCRQTVLALSATYTVLSEVRTRSTLRFFSGEGTTMIMREWGEIRQLYKACRPQLPRRSRATQTAWGYWRIWALNSLCIILGLLVGVILVFKAFGFPDPLSVFGFTIQRVYPAFVIIAVLAVGVLIFLVEKAFADEFKII